jgi:hypothetical protein
MTLLRLILSRKIVVGVVSGVIVVSLSASMREKAAIRREPDWSVIRNVLHWGRLEQIGRGRGSSVDWGKEKLSVNSISSFGFRPSNLGNIN